MMKKAIAVGIVSLFVVGAIVGIFLVVPDEVEAPGPTDISGLISVDTIWTVEDSPYHIIGDTTLKNGCTLTIEPGTIVKFANNTELIIKGFLDVNGNSSNRVVFTPLGPLYNYSENHSDPYLGGWVNHDGMGSNYDIHIDGTNGGYTDISYAKIEFAAYRALRIIGNPQESPITDTIFINNRDAISNDPTLINRCTFINNYNAIGGGNFILKDSIFQNNTYSLGGVGGISAYNNIFSNNTYGILGGGGEVIYNTFSNNEIGIKMNHGEYSNNFIYNNSIGLIIESDEYTFTVRNNNLNNNSEYNLKLYDCGSNKNVTDN